MKTFTAAILLSFLFLSDVFSQDFIGAVENPFGINIDTSGGVGVYTCNFTDIDGDDDIDIVYPFFSDSLEIAFQENIGTRTNPVFDPIRKLDLHFDADIGLFFPDFADMNDDGLVDIISFGSLNDSTGFNSTYFENKGDNVFESTPGSEIGLPGIGYAFGFPEIVDLNQDGDKDVILSGALLENFTDEADVMFYYGQNSSKTDPNFVGWFIEPYSFKFIDTFQAAFIRAGDLDLDGDLDLLMSVAITDDESKFMYQENISPVGETSDFTGPQLVSPFGLPEESSGLPFLEDLDGDGDLDLFLLDDITIIYYENTACINSTSNLNISLCGETSYTFNDVSYSSSGSYSQVIVNAAGCDSTIMLNLTLNNHIASSFEVNICEGSSYDWNGEEFMIAGDYQRAFVSANGCDSLVTLFLNVSSVVETSFEASFCAGSEYEWNNQSYDNEGTFEQSFTTLAGCDSIVTLKLTESIIEYQIDLVDNTLEVETESLDISWFDCDSNVQIDGENENEFIPSQTGNYAAIINQAACEMITECFNVVVTSIKEIAIPEFQIFPNPASNIIKLKGDQDLPASLEVQIYNLEGRMAHRKISNDQVDVSELNPGFYILNFQLEEQQLRLPFVKVK